MGGFLERGLGRVFRVDNAGVQLLGGAGGELFVADDALGQVAHALGGVGEGGMHVGAGFGGALFEARVEHVAGVAEFLDEVRDGGVGFGRGLGGAVADFGQSRVQAAAYLGGEFGEIAGDGVL